MLFTSPCPWGTLIHMAEHAALPSIDLVTPLFPVWPEMRSRCSLLIHLRPWLLLWKAPLLLWLSSCRGPRRWASRPLPPIPFNRRVDTAEAGSCTLKPDTPMMPLHQPPLLRRKHKCSSVQFYSYWTALWFYLLSMEDIGVVLLQVLRLDHVVACRCTFNYL